MLKCFSFYFRASYLLKVRYTAKCMATASGYTDSDPAVVNFTLGGTLAPIRLKTISLTSASRVAALNRRYSSKVCRLKEVCVKNKTTGSNVSTMIFDDFSFENKFLGYKTFYIFNNTDREFTLSDGVTASNIEISAKTFGNGSSIKDGKEVHAYEHEALRVIDFSAFGWSFTGRDDCRKEHEA